MKPLRTSEDILPIEDFEEASFIAAVDEGLSDVEAGRVLSDDELAAVLGEILGLHQG